MEEHDDGQDEQEGNRVTNEAMAQRIETMMENLRHSIPLSQSRRPLPQPTRMPLRQFVARGLRPYFAHYGQRRLHRPPTSRAPDCRTESRRRWWLPPAVR